MAYSLTTAANPRALLAAIVTFATAQGWTIEYNNAATATGNGGQIALTSGNCHVAIGERSASENPVAVAGGQSDGRLYAALATSIDTGISQYWGHPGSAVTTATDADRVHINDVWGPMAEVHLFGNGEYILCLVRSAASRWTTFGFGLLDNVGMTTPRCAFLIGEFWEWYSVTGSGTPNASDMSDAGNLLWQDGRQGSRLFFIPDNVLDPSLGFTDGAIMAAQSLFLATHRYNAVYGTFLETGIGAGGTYLDFAATQSATPGVANQPTTGGVPLFAVPVIYQPTDSIGCFLGEIPGLRICDISDIAPGDEKVYGSDTYLFAPLKQKGLQSDSLNGVPNTYGNGFAFKKVA